jgi:hypothetical protein
MSTPLRLCGDQPFLESGSRWNNGTMFKEGYLGPKLAIAYGSVILLVFVKIFFTSLLVDGWPYGLKISDAQSDRSLRYVLGGNLQYH